MIIFLYQFQIYLILKEIFCLKSNHYSHREVTASLSTDNLLTELIIISFASRTQDCLSVINILVITIITAAFTIVLRSKHLIPLSDNLQQICKFLIISDNLLSHIK